MWTQEGRLTTEDVKIVVKPAVKITKMREGRVNYKV